MKKNTSPSSLVRLTATLASICVTLSSAQSTDPILQAGYHVIHSYPGLEPPSSLLDLTRQGKVGGIILFGENVGSSTVDVIESFQSAYTESPSYNGEPLLILTDQEGGEVKRLPGGPTLSEKDIGSSSADPNAAATTAGHQAASALRASECNGNLAPVLGVYREAGDFLDQYERSYSNNPDVVGECAAAFIATQQGDGIIATAKHFPGLGAAAADEDTDAAPVTINLSLDELRSVDEAPYVKAIDAGVQMVMPSWALYPALDSTYPSGVSSSWIKGELRGRLGFAGVTISDAIEAGGLNAFGKDPGHRAVLATLAGMDIILAAARNATQGEAVVEALANALSDGTLDAADFAESTQRIIDLRNSI